MSEERNTQREIAQDKMNGEIMLALGELKGEMKGTRDDIKTALGKIEDHEKRISASEDTLDNIKLKIGLVGAFIGAVVSVLGNWIWGKLTAQK